MKELIDYFNEKYTKKKEYICKDLKPIKLLNDDEYMDFRDDAGLINPQEINYYPLFKVPKIKNNRPMSIGYILKTNIVEYKEYKGIMKQSVIDGHKENRYDDNYIMIVINGDEIALETYDISINENNCSLTLYADSPELPKIEYPKNRMDMYRAMNFIRTTNYVLGDNTLENYLKKIELPFPKNIDEMDLYSEDMFYIIKDVEIKINAQYMDIEEFIGENWDSNVPKPSDKGWCVNLPFGVRGNGNIVTFKKDGKKQTFTMGSGRSFNEKYIGTFDKSNKLYFLINKETFFILKIIFFDKNIDLNNMKFECIKRIDLMPKGFYYINPDKDSYYTILNAIKSGKKLFDDYEIYSYWEINKEEKSIWIRRFGTFTETKFEPEVG